MAIGDVDAIIVAKLRTEGCYLDEKGCTDASMCFIHTSRQYTFFVPRQGDEWRADVLEVLHAELEFLDVDLLPLDGNAVIH